MGFLWEVCNLHKTSLDSTGRFIYTKSSANKSPLLVSECFFHNMTFCLNNLHIYFVLIFHFLSNIPHFFLVYASNFLLKSTLTSRISFFISLDITTYYHLFPNCPTFTFGARISFPLNSYPTWTTASILLLSASISTFIFSTASSRLWSYISPSGFMTITERRFVPQR